MTTDYRALCAEIIDAHDADEGMSVSRWTANLSAVINRARAALAAQPEPPPTLKEQALEQLRSLQQCGAGHRDTDKIRQALEAL